MSLWSKRKNGSVISMNSTVLKLMLSDIRFVVIPLQTNFDYNLLICHVISLSWRGCLWKSSFSQKADRTLQQKMWVDVWDCSINCIALPISTCLPSFSVWGIRDLPKPDWKKQKNSLKSLYVPEWPYLTADQSLCIHDNAKMGFTLSHWLLSVSAEGGPGDKERFN